MSWIVNTDMSAAEREGVRYLLDALPEADRIALSEDALVKIVRHAQMTRAATAWGASIPEDVFRAFVLFPRVNNENLEFYQGPIWEELSERIAGKSMDEAVREVNFWCYEKATYQSTDDRTACALTTVRRTFGRCGEESTLLVSALRSVGIPARQVYVPRWAHCDDNHAWVEAWVDGEWRYLGACEPEPVLNSGWFTAAASKAMLVHTRAYGVRPVSERVENADGNAYVINRTAAYAKTALLAVRVTENGAPRPGLKVRFELANMSELYPINEQITDEGGADSLLTGLGTLHLHVHDGERFLCRMVDVSAQTEVELDFGDAAAVMEGVETFDQRPPLETRIQPVDFPPEETAAHEARLRRCEAIREDYKATFRSENVYLKNACGNHAAIQAFLSLPGYDDADKRALLDTLREKDFVDATVEMLEDALAGALPYRDRYPREIWVESVLKPRVRNEMLLPVRAEARSWLGESAPADAHALWTALEERLTLCDMGPANLTPDLRAVMRSGRCSADARDVLFVACARALGIAARLNPATGEKEFYDGAAYRALFPARQADAALILVNRSGRELQYGVHFTVGVLENGAYRTLHLYGRTLRETLEIPVFAGRYRVITCARQIDGAVDGWMAPAEVAAGESVRVEVELRRDCTPEKLLYAPLPPLRAHRADGSEAIFPEQGMDAILAFAAPGQEPTEHFFNELLESREELENRGVAVRIFVDSESDAENEKLKLVLETLKDAELLFAPSLADVIEWRRLMRAGDLRRPFTAAVGRSGEGLFAFANYNVGSVQSLLRVIAAQ